MLPAIPALSDMVRKPRRVELMQVLPCQDETRITAWSRELRIVSPEFRPITSQSDGMKLARSNDPLKLSHTSLCAPDKLPRQ